MRFRLLAVVLGVTALIPISFGIDAQPDEKMGVTRDIAARVGQILGGASACKDVAPARIKTMSDKLQSVFNFATGNAADLKALKQLYEKNAIEGQRAVTARQKECAAVERDFAELEGAIKSPAVPPSGLTAFSGPAPAATPPAPPPEPARTVGANPGAPATAALPWPSTAAALGA